MVDYGGSPRGLSPIFSNIIKISNKNIGYEVVIDENIKVEKEDNKSE